MDSERKYVIAYSVLAFIIFFPISVTNIILSQKENSCDYEDDMGLNISDYLLGLGISGLVSCFLVIVGTITSYIDEKFMIVSFVLLVIPLLFNNAWIIVGGIIMFRSNVDCIGEGGTITIYALVMWALSVLPAVRSILFPQQSKSK